MFIRDIHLIFAAVDLIIKSFCSKHVVCYVYGKPLSGVV